MTRTPEQLVEEVAALDQRLLRLAQDGVTAPHRSASGFEGALVACGLAVEPNDWIFWGQAVCAPALVRGLSAEHLFAQALDGLEVGQLAQRRIVTCTLGPATRVPQAAGLAWSGRNDGVVALVELGEDALSDGDVHVGLNLGAVLGAPLVVVVRSTGRRPVAARGEGYGIAATEASARLDEALPAVGEAVTRARRTNTPQLVELRQSAPVAASAILRWEEPIEAALAAAERRLRESAGQRPFPAAPALAPSPSTPPAP